MPRNYEVQIGFFASEDLDKPADVLTASFATLADAYAETLSNFRSSAAEDGKGHVREYEVRPGYAGIFATLSHPSGEARARIVPLN